MGFRSTLAFEDGYTHFNINIEQKFYGVLKDDERLVAVQEYLIRKNSDYTVTGILIHECGGITRLEITKDKILANEPIGWNTVTSVQHEYCYGCSDVQE